MTTRSRRETIDFKHPFLIKGVDRLLPLKTEESLRLGVVSGWYSTKVSGTFVSGPHDTEADCLRRIAELDPPPLDSKR